MRYPYVVAITAMILACAPARTRRIAADDEADRAALLRLHAEQRVAHVDRRADLIVASQADSMLSISNGRVSVADRERTRVNFQQYFDASTFRAWDDIVPPRIRISPDGLMAYVVVEKRVDVTTTPRTGGAATTEKVRYAWLSVYEKRDGRWLMTAIASTDRPDAN